MSRTPPDFVRKDVPAARAHLLQANGARSSAILARTMFNEMLRAGRSRADMLEFVNAFLGLVSSRSEQVRGQRATQLYIDPVTGYATRRGLCELLLHELNPEQNAEAEAGAQKPRCGLLLIRLSDRRRENVEIERVRHVLRRQDVVVPIGRGLLVVVVHGGESSLSHAAARVAGRLGIRSTERTDEAIVGRMLRPGDRLRQVWRDLFTELKRSLP